MNDVQSLITKFEEIVALRESLRGSDSNLSRNNSSPLCCEQRAPRCNDRFEVEELEPDQLYVSSVRKEQLSFTPTTPEKVCKIDYDRDIPVDQLRNLIESRRNYDNVYSRNGFLKKQQKILSIDSDGFCVRYVLVFEFPYYSDAKPPRIHFFFPRGPFPRLFESEGEVLAVFPITPLRLRSLIASGEFDENLGVRFLRKIVRSVA